MSDRTNIQDWFLSESDCLSPEQVNAYYAGALSEVDKHAVERHLVSCDLCAAAFGEEDMDIPADELSAAVADISDRAWSRVEEIERKKRRRSVFWLSSAAGLALLVVVGFLVFQNASKTNMDEVFAEQFQTYPLENEKFADAESLEEKAEKKDEAGLSATDKLASGNATNSPSMKYLEKTESLNDQLERTLSTMDEMPQGDLSPVETVVEEEANDFGDAFEIEDNDDVKSLDNKENGTFFDYKDQVIEPAKAPAPKQEAKSAPVDKNAEKYDSDALNQGVVVGELSADLEAEELEEVVITAEKSPELVRKENVAPATIHMSDDVMTGSRDQSFALNEVQLASKSGKNRNRSKNKDKGLSSKKEAKSSAPPGRSDDANYELDTESIGNSALENYRAGYFSAADQQFEVYFQYQPQDLEKRFYAGVNALANNDAQTAIEHLDIVLASTNISAQRREEATWYKALALIKGKQKRQAKALLENIVAGKGTYAERAAKALADL